MTTSDDLLQLTHSQHWGYSGLPDFHGLWTVCAMDLSLLAPHCSILKTNAAISYWLFYYVKGISQILKGDYLNFYKNLWVLLLLLFLLYKCIEEPRMWHPVLSSGLGGLEPPPKLLSDAGSLPWSVYQCFRGTLGLAAVLESCVCAW